MAQFEEGNQFSKGKGRPALPSDLKEARKANAQDVERIINKFLQWSVSDLAEYCKDPHNPVLECLIASIMGVAIRQGDPARLTFLLDRVGIKSPVKSTDTPDENNIHAQVVGIIHKIEKKDAE